MDWGNRERNLIFFSAAEVAAASVQISVATARSRGVDLALVAMTNN
jgi:hypothetical protein